MGRERQPGDWAAWMGSATASPPSSGPEHAAPPGDTTPPAAAIVPVPEATSVPVPEDADTPADPHRSARREVTRQRILDAARQVFAEMGVIGGTVEDICERAGFTRGAFYSNFTDKDDVVEALVERENGLLLAHLDASFVLVEREVAAAPDLASAIASLVNQLLRTIPVDRQLSLVQTELEIFAIRRPDLAGRFLETNNRFRARIGAFMNEAISRNGLELLVDPSILTDAIVAIAERSVRRALLAGEGADPDAMANAILPGMLLAFTKPAGS